MWNQNDGKCSTFELAGRKQEITASIYAGTRIRGPAPPGGRACRLIESIYRQILALQPDQPDALHFLGLIAHQTGRHEEAIDCIKRAIRLHGTQPAYHNNLGGRISCSLWLKTSLRRLPVKRGRFNLSRIFVEAQRNLGLCETIRGGSGRSDRLLSTSVADEAQ